MKRQMFSALTAVGLIVGAHAATAQTVVISPEQETVITHYVTKHKVASVDVSDIAVGSALPDTVELHRIDEPDITYSYVIANGKTVVVEPSTRKIVRVLD